MKDNMFYGASNLIFQRAEELRNRMTPAEESLWRYLHINEWKLKFRRQHPVSNYVVDFYCHAIKLVIELDGGIHDVEEVKRIDAEREQNLKELGLTVLRFKNEEVFQNRKIVLETISKIISELKSPPLEDNGKKLYVIKIGGNIIDNELALRSFLKSFSEIVGGHTSPPSGDGGTKAILIHGGGKLATRMAEAMGIQQQMVDGRRITDAETLKIVTMVYAGHINKNIVAQLQSFGCNAIGMSGADSNVIKAHKRVATIDYGFVGDIDEVNAEVLYTLLQINDAVVLAPITHDGKGQLLNTNADTIAQETAKAMSRLYHVHLIYSFEKSGVLLDVNDESSVISRINPSSYQELKTQQKIFAGMLPKLENAFAAVNSGVQKVIIGKAEELHDLINGSKGTAIVNE
ncbi:MAG: acetylglutamate kinase [Chitinophagaceae bacterium]|nr:acetylglutamate kinase [Chitinophagaceae bacterium]